MISMFERESNRIMNSAEFGYNNLLAPQSFTHVEEAQAIENTLFFDCAVNHHTERIKQGKVRVVAENRGQMVQSHTLLLTMIMLTGECNASCEVCYTARRVRPDALKWDEIQNIIDQCRELGSQTVYVAGEGEPTLDDSFFKLVDYVAKIGTRLLVFSNGVLFSNDELALRKWGITGEEMIRRLADAPVWVYHKLWSIEPEKNRLMMGLPRLDILPYTAWLGTNGLTLGIPVGLERMLQLFPRDRLGVETIAERRNAQEVVDKIIPFVLETGVKSYIEPVIHSGRNFANHNYDLPEEFFPQIQPYMVRQNCTRVGYLFAVHNNGYTAPCISILPQQLRLLPGYEDLNIRNPDGSIKDIFTMRHTHPLLVQARQHLTGCLCEKFNLKLAELTKAGTVNGCCKSGCLKYEDILC